MKFGNFLLGGAAGFSVGYVALRTWEALVVAGRPTIAAHDAKTYGRLRRALTATGTVRSILGTVGIAYSPLTPLMVSATSNLPRWSRAGVCAAAAVLVSSALEIGVEFVDEYEVERRYGLTNQSPRSWLADYVKTTALSTVVTGALAIGGAAAIRRFPKSWPWIASAAFLPLVIAANVLVPIFVLPLFNTFEPLQGPLEQRLRALAARYGVGEAEILRMDMSRQTKKANAFVVGLGSTHRIVLGDTLVEAFPEDEIHFVVAHELGHYVHRDTWRMVAIAEAGAVVLLTVAATAVPDDGSDDSGTVRLLRAYALLGAGMLAIRPALLAFSRSREWAADRFAIAATNDSEAGAAAFRRLRDQNLAEEEVPGWYEHFFSSHPSLGKRIEALAPSANSR